MKQSLLFSDSETKTKATRSFVFEMNELQLFERGTGLAARLFVDEVIAKARRRGGRRAKNGEAHRIVTRLVRQYVDDPVFASRISTSPSKSEDLAALVRKWMRESYTKTTAKL